MVDKTIVTESTESKELENVIDAFLAGLVKAGIEPPAALLITIVNYSKRGKGTDVVLYHRISPHLRRIVDDGSSIKEMQEALYKTAILACEDAIVDLHERDAATKASAS
jgi:hypothetical protein